MWGLPGPEHDLPKPAVYRGWMLKPLAYRDLYRSALAAGALLINSPDEYRFCHELPSWYARLEASTPKSVWFKSQLSFEEQLDGKEPEFDLDHILAEVHKKLGFGPLIVKDFVKSCKHEWDTACYIPGTNKLAEVTRAFVELQGDDLNSGLVYREYVPLRRVGTHPKSGMPVFNEVRVWFLSGVPLMTHTYWGPDEGGLDIEPPEGQFFTDEAVSSNFYTMDMAQQENGRWIVIELGDGQVSGLPEHVLAPALYEGLVKRFAFPS